ncbi:hypothetical protein [Christiangramia sp.]|uniref:hypothetical protein n=1 Tax=Christiangramia sp. TaxID=1931228 RepID=UPI002621A53C|nr:hypothetical protein [Christiangramia sp.]
MNKIDKEIDENLQLLFNSPGHQMWSDKLVNPADRDDYLDKHERENIANKLERENLIIRTNEILDITSFGIEVSELGGWIEYKKAVKERERQRDDFSRLKNELETRNLELSNENLEYQRSNRKLLDKINNLQSENLQLQNMKLYLGFAGLVIGFLLGFVLPMFF